MSSDEATRSKIREAIVRHSSMIGLGLSCPHCGGDLHGGDWQSDIRDAFNPQKNGFNASVADTGRKFNEAGRKIKHEFTDPNSLTGQVARKVTNEFVDKDSLLRAKYLPAAAKVGNVLAPLLDAIGPGLGTAVKTGLNGAQTVNQGARELGYGLAGGSDDGRLRGRWSEAAKARARQRSENPNSHASKVKAYLKKHPGTSLGEASRAVSGN